MGSISYLSAPNFKLTIHWTPPTQIGISNIKPAVLKDAVGTEIALKLYNAAKLAKRIAYCSAVIKNICFEVWLHPVTFWRVLPPSEEGDLDSDKEIGLQVERVRDGSGWKIFSD